MKNETQNSAIGCLVLGLLMSFCLLFCQPAAHGDETVKRPVTYMSPATLTIQSGVPLLGTWDFSSATTLGLTAGAGGSSGEFQWNNAGALDGLPTLTTDGAALYLLTGQTFFEDSADPSKRAWFDLSLLNVGATIGVKIPGNVGAIVPVADSGASNNFLTGLGADGLFTKARPTITNLTNLSGTSKLIGSNASSAAVTEITLGTNLSMSGSTLNATGGGGIGGTNGFVLWNNSGTAATVSSMATDGTTLTQAAGSYWLATGTKLAHFDLSSITNGTDRTVKIPDAATSVTIPLMSANSKLLGSSATGSGLAPSEITLGTNLSMSGSTLNATGGGGAPGGSDTQIQYNNAGALGGVAGATSNGSFLFLDSGRTTFRNETVNPFSTAQINLGALPAGGAASINIPNATASTTVVADAGAANNFLTGITTAGAVTKARPTIVNLGDLTATSKLVGSGSAASTVGEITLGSGLSMTGSTLDVTAGGGNVSNSGTPTVGQSAVWTDATHVKGVPELTYGGSPAAFTLLGGNRFYLADPTATTKTVNFDLSNIAADTTRIVNVPNANSTTVQADTGAANNFLTGISAQGLPSKARPTISNLTDLSAVSKLVGSGAGGAGVTEITLGTNLSMSGGTLNATGGGVTDGDKGDITVSGSGATWAIDSGAVTLGKLASMSATSLLGRDVGAGSPSEITLSDGLAFSGSGQVVVNADKASLDFDTGILVRGALTGDVTASQGSNSTTIANNAVTYGKMQAASAASKLVGSPSTGTTLQEITLGTNLSMSNGTLNASGAGGGNVSNTGTPVDNQVAVWTDSTHVEGNGSFTYDGTKVLVPAGSGITPGLAMTGDDSTGFVFSGGTVYAVGYNGFSVGFANTGAWVADSGGYGFSTNDVKLTRLSAGVMKVTDGSTGTGTIIGNGTVPTGGTTDQVLAKNSNTNYDLKWATAGGGGNVSNVGTPLSGQYARWTGATTIEGVAASTVKTDLALTASDVGLGNVTNNAQTQAAVMPNTAPTSGQIPVGNAGGTAYAKQTISGSGATVSLSDAGVLSISAIPNATLSNSAITIAGTSTSLGGTISRDTITGLATTGIVTRTGANALGTITDNSAAWDTASSERRQWDGGSTNLVAATGRTSLGGTTVGSNLFTLTNPSAISFLRVNADNTVTAQTAANFRTDLSLVVGTNVQAWDTDLDTWATKTPYAGTVTVTTGKTLNASNTLSFAGTDSTTITFQGTDTYVGRTTTDTLTNKRITARTATSATNNTTPTPNSDTTDLYICTGMTVDMVFGAPTGTPTEGQQLEIRVKGTAARALSFNAAYRFSTDIPAPTTTTTTTTMYLGFQWNATDSKWDCLAKTDGF